MSTTRIRVGEIYKERRPPRHAWRVTEDLGDCFRLERIDMPGVVRFPDAAVLRDRYVREETG